ncbi:3-dehydroquinate synthase [Nitrospiraceae bacterium HYJII51-Mn-bac16s-1-B09]|uniref:3-dehydroquinate synthase n=2 Tax=Candidatus Manganitrophus noduliformans TaxID=2606439 RepID=A0A7X6DTK0_9BACT|nr:3-dehydroquinate synthase [Candidatus Manganitrophus noduliformans]
MIERTSMSESIQAVFDVPYHYPVHFTMHLFSPENRLFIDTVGEGNPDRPCKTLFVIDRGLFAHHPELPAAIEAYCSEYHTDLQQPLPPLLIEGGEAAKNHPEHVARVHEAIHEAGLCRHSYLVAIGGGALLDMAGYAAATAHRGIRLIRVPTTVLGQNDAGVGVKNSINAFGKKNFLGAFSPPHAVLNDRAFLSTLSDRDWRSGIAEAIKVALIKDPDFFSSLERRTEALVARDIDAMDALIRRCAEMHVEHIAMNGDPFERGASRPLDFGHWSAHKLEQMTGYTLRHGEAVAVGIALDTTYSYLAGLLDRADWERTLALLSAVGLPRFLQELRHPALLQGLDEFREHLGGPLTLTLLKTIGRGAEVHEIDPTVLSKSIELLEKKDRCKTKGEQQWKALPSPAR